MPAFIILTVIIVVVVLVAKSIHDAQSGTAQQQPSATRPSAPPRPSRRPARSQPRPRRPVKPIDEEALAEHVSKLRDAIQADLVTTEEAVASICRFADGVLSDEAARELLRRQGAA
ncbi:MAG TPA: hypothetical protein VM287_12430 [Egibacteraceae bacterium]|nr:hypothetical protein [Egibacteraceae bacterium]